MTQTADSLRTPLSRARGLGAAGRGTEHFMAERVSGLALVPLFIWAAISAPAFSRGDFTTTASWLAEPLNAVLSILLVVVGFFHLRLTVQVMVEDYIEGFVARSAALLLNLFLCVLGSALGVFAILKVAFVSGAL